jgi:hypothetical protein
LSEIQPAEAPESKPAGNSRVQCNESLQCFDSSRKSRFAGPEFRRLAAPHWSDSLKTRQMLPAAVHAAFRQLTR